MYVNNIHNPMNDLRRIKGVCGNVEKFGVNHQTIHYALVDCNSPIFEHTYIQTDRHM